MHKLFLLPILLLLFIMPTFLYADNNVESKSYWTCIAFDNANNNWKASHEYKRVAMNKALDDCKKESKAPKHCEALSDLCVFFGLKERTKTTESNHQTAPNTSTQWQCIALDQTAKPWVGLPKINKYDAALNAKNYCRDKSTLPDTCYINLLTCINLKEPDNEFSNTVPN